MLPKARGIFMGVLRICAQLFLAFLSIAQRVYGKISQSVFLKKIKVPEVFYVKKAAVIFAYTRMLPQYKRPTQIFALLVLVSSAWFAVQFVLAEKKLSVYVFPSVVTSEGFENDIQALGQDLSLDAELADFNRENSAYVFLGGINTESVLEAEIQEQTSGGVIPSLVPSTIIPEENSQTPGSEVDTGSQESSSTATGVEAVNEAIPTIPNPIIPTITFPVETEPQSTPTSEVAPDQQSLLSNFLQRISRAFGAHIAVAQDIATTTIGEGAGEEEIEVVEEELRASTSPEAETFTPMSGDPYTVLSCRTLGIPCHMLEFAGFGLGGALDTHPLQSATVEISLAGRGVNRQTDDRILVRAYHSGRWEFLGDMSVVGEFSNSKRGGYLSFSLEKFAQWGDLSDLKIVVEYVRESEEGGEKENELASAYVDGVWINVVYEEDVLGEAGSPESLALTSQNLRSELFAKDAEARKVRRDLLTTSDGDNIAFVHVDEHDGAALTLKTDKVQYHALGHAQTYFNVTNESDTEQVLRLQFYFPNEGLPAQAGGKVTTVSRYTHGIPYKMSTQTRDAIGYFCASGWRNSTSTNTEGASICQDTQEFRSCDAYNEEKTNCVQHEAQVGLEEHVEYRAGWSPLSLQGGSFRDEGGLFAKAIDSILNERPDDAIPSSQEAQSHLSESILIPAGSTFYFQADMDVPLNGRGDFYVEAAAEGGAYGLVHATFDGSWNYRAPVDIDNEEVNVSDSFVIPIELSGLPKAFWSHIKSDGSDVRFVDGGATMELPYWLASFDHEKEEGLAWVRVPKGSTGTTTRIFVYAGDQNAESASDEFAPFRTTVPTPRGVIFGGSQRDMTLQVIALTDNTHVQVEGHEDVLLKEGESALFNNVAPGMKIFADAPLSLAVNALAGQAGVVPMGYAGMRFVIPGIGKEREVALSVTGEEPTHAVLSAGGENATALDPIEGSIVKSPVTLSESTRLDASDDVLVQLASGDAYIASPLYPATREPLYGVARGKVAVGFGTDASNMTAMCSSGARKDIDGRRTGMTTTLDHCPQGGRENTEAIHVFNANHSIGTIADDNEHLVSYIPKSEFASTYILPKDASHIYLLCDAASSEITVGVFDSQKLLVASTTCQGRGQRGGVTHLAPGGDVFPLGSTLRSMTSEGKQSQAGAPFMAVIESEQNDGSGSVMNPLMTLSGAPLYRSQSPNHPKLFFGKEEFVVPGEHRKLDVDAKGNEKPHVNKFLSKEREFSMRELPGFMFQYTSQSNGFMQSIREAFDVAPFTVAKVTILHPSLGEVSVGYDIAYGANNEWSLALYGNGDHIRPGKYTLHVEIEEGGEIYIDEYDFYWGVLAINYNKSIFLVGETMDISLAALSNNGNTICDARLKLWIIDPIGVEAEAPINVSGQCDGNNVVTVPDYSAKYSLPSGETAIGTYKTKLVRLDDADNVASQVADTFEVRATVPYSIERVGPTRIYPVAHYTMKIRVRAHEAFEGDIVERVPGDFVFIDRGNGNLEWSDPLHTFITATWPVKLSEGEVIDLEYKFDAPDRSPYLYLLGPLTMKPIVGDEFVEARQWQVASDAVGKMIVFWDDNTTIPAGWTCLSCLSTDVFYQRLPVGSTTYGGVGGYGGAATHTPTALGTVYSTSTGGIGPNTTNNTNNATLGHTHTLTPSISGVSNLPNYRSLRVIQHDNAGEPANLPAGVIVVFDVASSSLPSGWNRHGAQDGYYAYAASSSAVAGGANTHSHTATGTTSVPPEGGRRSNGGSSSAAPFDHTHRLSTSSTDVVNNEPPYREVLFAKLPVATTTISNYIITMWDDSPPAGWASLSGSGGALNGKFLKASTTYGTTGGSSASHTHTDIIGATTTVATGGNVYNPGATAQAPSTHFHTADITGFSSDSTMPPSIDVIFAKRLSGIVQWTQNSYRWYVNANVNTPTDPWPSGGSDLSEDGPIDSSTVLVKPSNILRLRMNLGIANATATPLIKAFKLQYVASSDCANALNWTDVDAIGGAGVWRGYNNTSVTDGALMTSTLLSTSHVAESYVEANNSPGIPNQATTTQRAEWDWVIQDNSGLASINYCFRMVLSDGTPLDTYTEYPKVLTNAAPNTTTLSIPFTNEKIGTTTPTFQFYATDPDIDDLDYQIQVDTSTAFLTTVIDADSTINPELFDNITTPANKAPFTQGETIQHKPGAGILANGTTYWWRVRAKDPNGSNTWGNWATMRSFTVDTTVVISTWHQTTSSQFQTDTLSGVNSSSSDHVMLNVGSTTGTIYGSSIAVSQALIGTVWGSLRVSSTTPPGTLSVRLEYYSATSTWDLIPESVLPGNSTGLTASTTSLLGVDPTVYTTIRMRADFTNSGGTPILLDWTIAWGYNVVTPTLYIPFDNAKVATATPYFEFTTTDPQGDDLTYEISWATSSAFTSSTTRSSASGAGWENLTTPADTNPFNSGGRIRYTIQSSDLLGASSTYFWKVRARDPSGANNYSFWSSIRSVTVDLSILSATWFQTAVDQFITGSLTSIYRVSTTSLTVATTTDEIMLAYGEGSVATPRYRIWDGITLGGELSALTVGAQISWVVLKASPLVGQYILATLGTDRDINYQVYENGAWDNQMELLTTAPSLTRRSFDVVFQTISGQAIAVSCDGSTDAKYQIWNGTAWAATGTLNLSFATNCEWVRMASSPTTNEVIALFRNTGSTYEAQVWNATTSTWGNSMTMGSMTEIAHEGMAIEYEKSGNQAIVVTSNGNTSDFIWNSWDGTAWAGSSIFVLGDDFEWGNLRRNTNNDDMVLCYVDHDLDIGSVRWTGAGFVAAVELEVTGVSKDGRPVDCQYETLPGRTNYIMIPYSDTVGTRYQYWDTAAYVPEVSINTIPFTYTSQLVRTSASGTMLGLFFDHTAADYLLAPLIGAATWGTTQTVEDSASVTSAPYGEPFFMAPKNFTTRATIIGTTIDFDDGLAPAWNQALWSVTLDGASTFKVQIEYYNTASSTWDLIPDTIISGNSSGTSTSPINIRTLNTTTYNQIRLVGNMTCVAGNCPTLNHWTVEWAQGLNISGQAKAHDLSANVTSGTVAVAVNGVLQTGKTGTISASGLWTIANVTFFTGDIIEVWVSGGSATSRAVAVAKYAGSGDFGGLKLYEHWVTLGSASTTGQSLTLTNLGLYDNSVSSNVDIFFDVDAGGDYNHCAPASGWCYDSGLLVLGGNTFRPSTATAETLTMFDFRLEGYMQADQNTMKVGGLWRNLGGFTSGAGTVVFNGTTSTYTIDSTSAATSTFYNVTFGEAATQATWSFSTAFVATGTVAMNFGTTSPGTQTMTLQGDLSIGASGTFLKGSATTTFSGSVAKTWTDSTASKQDLGNILIDGTTKTITLSSSVKATNVTIGANDTLSLGDANTMTVLGYWENNNTLTALTGTVLFAATTTGKTINQGASSFYNLTFNGVGGAWRWLNTNATTSNDLTIAAGTITLPGGTLAIGGSFDNSGGTFDNNFGVVRFTATASGKNVRQNGSSFNDVIFAGAGGAWTFLDTNATTSNNFTITAGTPIFPTGVLAVGNNFDNTGSFTANGGTLKMTSTALGETIRLSGSSLGALYIGGSGTFSILDTSATATGTVTFFAGTTTLPSGTFTVGGSFLTTNGFVPNGGTVFFNGSSGTKTITTATSSFANVEVNGTASFAIATQATTTSNFTLTNANVFTLNSGLTLTVGGTFSTVVGGASTTWAGATLALNSGTSYSINTKTAGGDTYGTLRLAANTRIRSWDSSATTYVIDSAASLYSQDHAGVSGAVNIFGAYARTSGADYWSAATDFDGVALATSSQRGVAVRFDSGATANFSVASALHIVGTSTATTTIDRIATGNYGLTVSSSTINAVYYKFSNLNSTGLYLTGSTTVTSLANGDFTLGVIGGSSLTVASTTINQNPALQIFTVSFATSTGISSGSNITATGTLASFSSYWRFRDHYGNYDGEANDNDPGGNPGEIRWDDSSFVIEVNGTVYSDAGVTLMGAPTCDGVTPVVRVKVDGVGNFAAACSATSSYYYVTGVTFSGDTVMTVYLDTAGTGVQAAIVTRSAAATLSGFNLYQHRVIVRHEDVTPMTIAAMNAYDFGDDPDVPFTATVGGTNTLVVNPDNEFWVWNAKTFVPGGNITLNSGGSGGTYDGTFHVDNSAVFTAEGTQTHSVGGRFVTDPGATFTAASTTFNFTATTTGKLITGVSPITFWKTNWNGVGGGWTISQNLTVGDTFTVATGTVSGTSNVTVNGTTLSGAGTIAMTAGTFTYSNGGTFGGLSDWSFFNLTFGSSSTATTTKTASSTVAIGGVLTVSANNVLEAGTSTTWALTGAGTPLVLTGTFTAQNGVVRYAAAAATTVTPAAYYQLDFGATGTNTPTYTLAVGTFTTVGALNVGMGSSTIYVNATTNDPSFTASGDVNIRASSTLVLSNSAAFTARRNWTNQGTTTPSGGTLTFDATTTGFIINTGSSSLANVVFNNSAGGWTISGSATTTGNFTLTAANNFTMASSTTLEVGGTFTNGIGGAATTWTGTTLYLNSGGSQTINTKTTGGDQYQTFQVGANTHVRTWDSVATTTTVNSTGSLYSQDHNTVSGSLYIWGNYTRSSGTDYWSYAADFDGSTSTTRQANVRFAPGSTMTLSGGGLEVAGTSTASTTIDIQSAGTFTWNITGGSTTMQYFSVRNTDANGLNISGTPVVNNLSDGDFELAVGGGTLIKVAGATIDANPLITFFRNRFATTTAITGNNVTATGVSASAWRFNLHYGNLGGEFFDSDPGGDPGYLIWDDSAAQLTISGNVYADEGITSIGSPTCNGVTQNVVLKVQGLGSYTSACNAGTGAYSISNVLYNPGDTITVYLNTNGGARAANIAYDPATNINNMHLYRDRVIVRHEQGTAVANTALNQYDFDQDSDISVQVSGSDATFFAGTKLIVWTSKTFAPAGNVSLYANASTTMFDGTAHLYANAVWSASGAQTHTIGGHFLAESGASVSPANSTFTFTATTSGKTIAASTTLTFYNLTFNGGNGVWNVSGLGTTTNNFTIATGTVSFPTTTLAIGGSLDNSGGTFAHPSGTVKFTSTATGKNIRTSSSTFSDLLFAGTGGGWTFLDGNATTTGSVTITAGTVTLPQGIFAVGNNFDNQSGAFSALSSSTLKMNATTTNRTLRFSGSYPGELWIAATGTFAFFDSHATTTGNVRFTAGTTTFPYASLYVGGSFINSAVFDAGTSTLTMFATSSGKVITTGSSSLYNLSVSGAGGGFTVTANATTTNNVTLTTLGTFTQTSGTTLAVGGSFTNLVGGVSTTWIGSTIALNSGTSSTLNTKTAGGDAYNTLRLSANTHVSMWDSTVASTVLDPASSIYSQDNGAVSGSLYIYGNYARSSGTDYWSYATDFDGTALGGSSRGVSVRFAANATATFSNAATLQAIGVASATTTVDRQASGNYALTLSSAYINASYYQFSNLNSTGLNLAGTTTITNMNNGAFTLDVIGGSMITIASSSIDQNASGQIFTVSFATSSGISSGYNVSVSGTTGSSLTFGSEYGNYASEAYDNDGGTACGSIRFTDSACLISDQRTYRWRNDDGGEGALSTEWYNQSWSKRQRVRLTTTGTSTLTNVQVKISVPYDADMQSDFDDLRFTDSSGTTSIASWTESHITSATATVWVKIASLPASSFADVFMYYGNAGATASSSGTSTFLFFDDFEDASLSEYSGNTTLFEQSTSFNYERTRGLDASAGSELSGKTTDGIGQISAGVGRDTTLRFFQYVDSTKGDEACFLFAMQSPITLHQNYGVCLSPFGADKLRISKNVANNGRDDGSTQLATKSITYATGWYETVIDWRTFTDSIYVTVYDATGAVFATTSASDASYTSGGVGFSYWGMHGGWDIPSARVYNSAVPTATFFTEQADSGATWKAEENAINTNQAKNQNTRLRITVKNSGAPLSNRNFRLQYAAKGAAANCESVATGNYIDVPTNTSGCGSEAACMKTSTQFSDKASSTQLLAIPLGFTHTYGQILEDPSNQTGNISLASSQFTEVEYNFQLTAFATQNSYCFRTTNAGTALDNYTKVPELTVLHGPTISNFSFNGNNNIALTEGTTTSIMATGTVTDLNGYADITNASSTFYRQSIAGARNCTANSNNCYQIATTSCIFSNCSGNACTVSCTAAMYFFADPTDVGSTYAAENWQALLDVWDTSLTHDNSTSSQELYTLQGLTTTSTLPYGSIVVGADSGVTNATTSVNNTGNSVLNMNVGGDDLYAGASRVTYNQQKYATSTFTYSACGFCSTLSPTSSPTYLPLQVSKATTTIWTPYKDIYWGINIPLGTAPTTFSGFNLFQTAP